MTFNDFKLGFSAWARHAATGFAIALLSTGLGATAAHAQWEPTENVEFVVPFGPGGGTDRAARSLVQILQDENLVDVPISIVNKPGASGAVGLAYLNRQPADGHHLSIMSTSTMTAHIVGTSPINYTDLTPITPAHLDPIAIAVNSESELRTLDDIADRLREDPKALSVTPGAGLGNPNHAALALSLQAKGVDVTQLRTVVFDSGGASVTAVLGGHVDVVSSSVANLVNQRERLHFIGVAAEERLDGVMADVPTLAEQGADVDLGFTRYVMGPENMNTDAVAYWERVFSELKKTDAWKAEVDKNFWGSVDLSSEETRADLDKKFMNLKAVLIELGLAQ